MNRVPGMWKKINYEQNDETTHNILTQGIWGKLLGINRIKNN